MTRFSEQALAAQRLGSDYQGSAGWSGQVAQKVHDAGPDDQGTFYVAYILLARLDAETAAQKAADREAERRYKQERRAAERHQRNARRRSALRGQLVGRGIASLLYAATAGYVGGVNLSYPDTPSIQFMWDCARPILLVCVATVAVATVVDWFLDNPGGGLRVLATTVGLFVGAGAWVDFASASQTMAAPLGSSAAGLMRADNDRLLVMPWAFGISWMIGSGLTYAMSRVTEGRPSNSTSRTIERYTRWRAVAAVLGGLAGISALFFDSCWGVCASTASGAWRLVRQVGYLHQDLLGIGGSGTTVVVLAALACLLTVAAAGLARLSRPWGLVAAVAGPVLGLVVFFAYPLDIVSVVVGAIVGRT